MRGRLTLTASIGAELQITGVLADVIYGVAYSATLGQFGGVGKARYTCTSTLPAGITFGDNGDGTCTFVGTTTASGNYPIVVNSLDAERTPAIRTFVLRVAVLPVTLTGDAGDMRLGDAPDTFSYGVTGGSGVYVSYAIGSGALPPGWTLNPLTGAVSRAPTTVGSYAWTVVVTDSLGNVSAAYADSAAIRYAAITLTGSFAALGVIGVPYSSDITITGGDGTYSNQRFTLGAVSGMALSIVTVSGVKKLRLSGTPTTHETDSITVAVDAHEFDGTVVTATHSQSLTEDPALTQTGTFATPATVGVAYQSDLLLGGGDGTFSLGNGGTGLAPGSGALPGGLALSIVTVSSLKYLRLSGNPTTAAANNFTTSVDAGDGQNVTSAQSVTVYAVLIAPGAFAEGGHVAPLTGSLAISGGLAPYSVAVLSGTPPTNAAFSVSGASVISTGNVGAAANGTYTYTLRVSSTDGQHVDVACTTAIVAAARSLKTKITSFWGMDSAITDQGRAGNAFTGSVSYNSGVGGRNALAPTSVSVNTGAGGKIGHNAYHGSQKFTFGGFIKPSTLRAVHAALGGTTDANNCIFIGSATGVWKATVTDITPTNFTATGSTTAATGTRAHVAVVCDGTNVILYVNGVQEASISAPTTQLNTQNISRFLLGSAGGGNYGSSADIQDLFFAHAALTANELLWMYNGGSGRIYSTISGTAYSETSHDTTLAALTPTGFWKLNQTSGTSATDSGSMGAGTLQNGAAFNNGVALPSDFGADYCALFDGSNDYMDLPAVNFSSGGLSYTQFGWFNIISQTDVNARYMQVGTSAINGTDARVVYTGAAATAVTAACFNGAAAAVTATVAAALSVNTWNMLAAVYDASSKVLLMTVNGLTVIGGIATANPTGVNCTVHRVGALSSTVARMNARAARVAFFKSATVSLTDLVKLSDLGRDL